MQQQNSFIIVQRFTALINRFELYDPAGTLIGFAEQKRFNLREQVTVWKTESREEVLFSIQAENVLDVHGKYLVLDSEGNRIGYLRKLFKQSLVRSTWEAYAADDTLLYQARERNVIIAIVRRIGVLVPVVGELLEQLPIRFDLVRDGRVVGFHRRIFGLQDKYEIAVEPELSGTDKRILLALGLLLDILQQR